MPTTAARAYPFVIASCLLTAAGCSSNTTTSTGDESTGGAYQAWGVGGTQSGGAQSSSSGGRSSGGNTSSGGYKSSGGAHASGGAGGSADTGGASFDAGDGDASIDGGDATDAAGGPPSEGGAGVPIPPPTPVGCLGANDVKPGVHQVTCDTTIDVVTVPEQCTKTACGVIIDVHGGMMSSQMEDKNTQMSALGVKHGYIVIQPNALQNPILLNQRLFTADKPGAPADDTRVMDILDDVMKAFHVDVNRIHMTGFSEGGFMTWRWYCQHSDLLASVAPGAAAWNCATLAVLGLTPPEVGCRFSGADAGADVPAQHIPALYMIGSKDGLVDPKCSDAWLASSVFPTLGLGTGQKIAGDATYTRTRYFSPDGVPFEYITHTYATTSVFLGFALNGHCFPGSTDLAVTPPAQTVIQPDQAISFGCNDKTSFNWGEEVMKFFIAHPKR